MKSYKIHREIRKRALVFGLPVPLFALQMFGVIASLLVIIFSFSFGLVLGAMLLNGSLYVLLLKLNNNPNSMHIGQRFPRAITNKKTNLLNYGHQH
jgi:hypothetical protein